MTTSDAAVKKLTENVFSLQRDVAQIDTLVERLDITIEKLTEVSSTVSQLLAVQGSRLEFQEKVQERLEKMFEERRGETEKNIKDLYVRIEKVDKDLQEDMEQTYSKIAEKIEQHRKESTEQHKVLNDRITRMEKWMWMLIGGAVVLSTLFNHINLSAIFGQ
jgi:DNA repair exonuclease SbcCD ATPase subunit